MALYNVETRFGTITKQADSIKEARDWAKKVMKAGPRAVSARRRYKLCEVCQSKPCCCPPRDDRAELEREHWDALREAAAPRFCTPGTNLTWCNLAEWVEAADMLRRRHWEHVSAITYRNVEAHMRSLPRHLVDQERDAGTLQAALAHFVEFRNQHLTRGRRGAHPVTAAIVFIQNQLQRCSA